MPSCWYVLQRFFLRVDSHLVRIHDLRILCDLRQADPSVNTEALHMEGSFDELTAAGISNTPVSICTLVS